MEQLERQMMNDTMMDLVEAPSQSRGGDIVAMGGDDPAAAIMPVQGSAQNTDEIAIDDDDDDDDAGAEKGPTGKQQMARMNIQEKAIPAAVRCPCFDCACQFM
jgi:hypothetical protein